MLETIDRGIRERRSIEDACADLRAKYERRPNADLARMIEQLEAEIAERRASKMVANVDLATAGAQELASAGVVPLRALLTTSWRPSR
jgi:hypothetical protein